MAATPLSACIITHNEADRIAQCIESLSFCDEVLVVDSHSTDGTRAIAARCGARVIERDWPGYREQKQFAFEAASHDWVLNLDADERVTPRLREEIVALKNNGFAGCAGWSMPRATWYFGKFLRHGLLYPDRKLRLIDRRRGGWRGKNVHEHLEVDGAVGKLRGDLEHYSYRNLSDQILRLHKYAELMAHEMHQRGRRCGLLGVLLRPMWRFFSAYILRHGFLDGWRGLVVALVETDYVRQKYLKLYFLNKGHPP